MFNTKGCLEDLIFGDFNDQPIPSTYSDLTNDYDDDGTQIDAALTDNKGLEDTVVTNDRNNNEDSLSSVSLPILSTPSISRILFGGGVNV